MYKDAHLPRKFLVVVDGTPESRAALRWAERRAHGNGGQLALLVVLEPGGFEHWLGVETLMKEEAKENAEEILKELSTEVEKIAGRLPETHIMEGDRIEQVIELINSDKTISTLVLAAGTDPASPGPLVGALANDYFSQVLDHIHIDSVRYDRITFFLKLECMSFKF